MVRKLAACSLPTCAPNKHGYTGKTPEEEGGPCAMCRVEFIRMLFSACSKKALRASRRS